MKGCVTIEQNFAVKFVLNLNKIAEFLDFSQIFQFLKKVMIKLSNHVIRRHPFSSSTRPSMSQVSNMSSTVFYDLETTGFGQAQIVGLGAVDSIGNTFHRYIIPTCSITP